MLINMLLASVPVISVYVTVLLVLLLLKSFEVRFKYLKFIKRLNAVAVIAVFFSIVTSPMVRPVNVVYDKEAEISRLLHEHEINKTSEPIELEGSGFNPPLIEGDYKGTPLFDKAMNYEK